MLTRVGSLMKKMGVLFPTRSQFPSSVYSLTANPRGSRTVSALPLSPPIAHVDRGGGDTHSINLQSLMAQFNN